MQSSRSLKCVLQAFIADYSLILIVADIWSWWSGLKFSGIYILHYYALGLKVDAVIIQESLIIIIFWRGLCGLSLSWTLTSD